MDHLNFAQFALGICAIFVLAACESTSRSARALPSYEPSLTKTDFQNVRTTAYTHTESDHREYSNRNALGGKLQAASRPIHRAENVARAIPVSGSPALQRASSSGAPLEPFVLKETRTTKVVKTKRGSKRITVVTRPVIGSAAADWGRWPAGTVFRLLSTGQMYRVEDYGWALAGRNTIDLYMSNSRDMNTWGARQEPIQILQWGDPQESLRFLVPRQNYKHVKRMILELEGHDQEAAALQ